MKRINVGCGQTPVQGWLNYDNSFSVHISKYHILTKLLYKVGILNKYQMEFIAFVGSNEILWADAAKHIPLADQSADVIYSSHMIEHLDRIEARNFLLEAYRVLTPNGIIRIAAPDIKKYVNSYLQNGDADILVDKTHLVRSINKTLRSKVIYCFVGDRHHQWMYDGSSLVKLVSSAGFRNCTVLPPGSTTISNHGKLNLREREDESVYIEAIR